MSWSIHTQGTPEFILAEIARQIEGYGSAESSQSRREFDAARPHLEALVGLNVGVQPLVGLSASGHAHEGFCQVRVDISRIS